MPPKDICEYQIGIFEPGGEFRELNQIGTCSLDYCDDSECVYGGSSAKFDQSLRFSCILQGNISDISMAFVFECSLAQVEQNNWRRMHRVPMKRRKMKR